MSFGAPAWLYLLWLVPPLVLAVWAAAAKRRRDLTKIFGVEMANKALSVTLRRSRSTRWGLWLIGISLSLLALAQPRWGYSWVENEALGLEVVVALDVSRSMDAQDIDPSRFVRAKREILDLLEELPESKIGLVVFAGGAYPRIPQTLDHRAIETVLAATDTSTIRAQGSSIAAALRESIDLMDFATEADRAIVLVSDGEGWDRDIDQVVSQVEEGGVRVYSIGVGGTSGAPIPTEAGFKLDRDGEMVMTRLDRSALERVAQSTGGAYVTSIAGNSDVVGIVEEMRSAMAGSSMGTRREKVWDERYQWPLSLGVLALLGSAFIGRGRVAAIVGLLLVVSSVEVAQATPSTVDSSDPRALWQMGEELFSSGDYEDAWSTFNDIATRSVESAVREQARYNAGLAAYGSGRLEDAVSDWEAVLELNPENEAAASNAEAVRQEIAQRMQPPPPESEDGESGEEGEEGEDSEESEESEDSSEESGDESESDGTREESDAGEDTGEMPPPETDGEMDETDDDDSSDQSEGVAGEPLAEGVQEISEQAAQHLLEGVEEGRPHVVVTGGSQERDW